jgi:hypothetical protein
LSMSSGSFSFAARSGSSPETDHFGNLPFLRLAQYGNFLAPCRPLRPGRGSPRAGGRPRGHHPLERGGQP